jgi:GT2 family glycosyltransferase
MQSSNYLSEPSVDIVISTYNRGDKIDLALASIRANTHAKFLLWVLDQSEDDRTEQCVRNHSAHDQRVHYLRVPLRGISPTRNIGVSLGNAAYVLFTNDDCQVAPTWISSLLTELINPTTWMAFGRVLPGQRSSVPTDVAVLALKEATQREIYQHNRLNLGFGQGHNFGIRREQFAALGGFDELLGAGGPLGSWDERDLGYRALRAGGQIVYTPDATVHHCHWQDWAGIQRSYRGYGIGAGAAIAKYLRAGDMIAILLLLEWFFSQGLRQTISGILKWHSWQKATIGIGQFFYPWLGITRSLSYKLNHQYIVYQR